MDAAFTSPDVHQRKFHIPDHPGKNPNEMILQFSGSNRLLVGLSSSRSRLPLLATIPVGVSIAVKSPLKQVACFRDGNSPPIQYPSDYWRTAYIVDLSEKSSEEAEMAYREELFSVVNTW